MLITGARTRTTLGLLLSHIDGTYQKRFWRGFLDFCREKDCGLIVYASRLWRGQKESFKIQEIVYRLAGPSRIDALCIDTSAFQNQKDLDAFISSSPKLESIPILFSSTGSMDRLRLAPDNRDGMRQALSHLCDVHGARKLAYVGGPRDIKDAIEREEAFREFVAERGLPLDRDWIVEATFDTPSGRRATARILDLGEGAPDAIAYANDLMAIGGLEVLAERGLRVPEEVMVTGFDGDELSLQVSPTLATVAQPIEDKARLAAEILLDAVDGRAPPRADPIPVSFTPRESCGCREAPEARRIAPPNEQKRALAVSYRTISSLAQITEYLGSVLSLEGLSARLAALVPILGLGLTCVLLHDEPEGGELPTGHCHLVCAVAPAGKALVESDHPRRVPSELIFPPALASRASDAAEGERLFVQALSKADRHFGFLVTEIREIDPAVAVSLRDHVTEVLFNISHVEELTRNRAALDEALERVTESERKFRELAQSLPSFVMETGEDGSIEYLNDQAKGLLEIEGKYEKRSLNLRDVLSEEAGGVLRDPRLREGGYRPITIVSRSGRRIPLLARVKEVDREKRLWTWSGFDYRSTAESLVTPDKAFLERFGLTRRETEILVLELRGLLAKEIAAELGLSVSTVKGHLGIIYRKVGVGSRDQLFNAMKDRLVGGLGFESFLFSLLSEALRS